MSWRRAVLALAIIVAAPSAAEQTNPLVETTDPADRAVMPEAMSAIASRTPDLARLDAVLAKLPRPTPLRGLIQTVRAAVLGSKEREGESVAAIEEAMRLLPDDPRPKLLATWILTFAGSPQRAADLWMQASRESPELARMSDRYVMMALSGRLVDLGDRVRADRINARLGELGFASGLAPERSNAALARTRTEVGAGQSELALQSVVAIGDPDDLLALYIDRRYEALWPRIADWASPTLEAQSRRYVEELRGDWMAADDFDAATPYARRLASLDAYSAVVSLFLPMFDRIGTERRADGAEFLAPLVARALVRVGRPADARSLLARVQVALPKNGSGAELNLVAAVMLMDMQQLDWTATLAGADAFLKTAAALKSSINTSATVSIHATRACALIKLGRAADAQDDMAIAFAAEPLMPGSALQVHACRGDVEAGRALVLRRLADPETRGWALRFAQPVKLDRFSPYERLMAPTYAAVRSAPDVVAAATKVGRVLPQPVLTDLPAGFDPFRSRPATAPLGPDAT